MKPVTEHPPASSAALSIGAIFKIWFLSRVWHAAFVYLGHITYFQRPNEIGGYAGVSNWWLNPWTTYDSGHFLSIAQAGYRQETTPFFPFYPLLLSPFAPNTNLMAFVGVVISNLAFLGALFLLYKLTAHDYNENVARLSVWILAFFPAGAAAMSVYTESLFLLLGIATFYCVRTSRPALAGVSGLLAALTRNSGPVFTLALGYEWLEKSRREKRFSWVGLMIAVVPLLAFIGVQLYFRAQFSDVAATISSQHLYLRGLTWPGAPLWYDFVGIVTGQMLDMTTLLNWGATVAAFVLVWKYRKVQPRADAILIISILMIHLTLARLIPPYTNGSLRYLFGLWPFSQLLALQYSQTPLADNKIFRLYVVVFGLLCAAIMAHLWGAKSFPG